jgi:lysophospholipase L1-like esterase
MKKLLILAVIILIAAAVYLNRAYSHIYGTIGAANLKPADGNKTYIINDMTRNTLIYTALGDSLSAGAGAETYQEALPYVLAEKLSSASRQVILNNRSLSGIETEGIIADFLSPAVADTPNIVTVLIGANDIHNKVTAARFEANYEEIVSRLKNETTAKIYLISIPFIGADSLMPPPYQKLFDARTREFNVIIKKIAAKYGINYIDLYSPTVDLFKRSGDHYSKDLFHPSAKGYQIWADIIYADINN